MAREEGDSIQSLPNRWKEPAAVSMHAVKLNRMVNIKEGDIVILSLTMAANTPIPIYRKYMGCCIDSIDACCLMEDRWLDHCGMITRRWPCFIRRSQFAFQYRKSAHPG